MSSKGLVVCLPLAVGSALISMAVLTSIFGAGAFVLEWAGSFLAFAGLSCLVGPAFSLTLAVCVLVAGNVGDLVLIGGLKPLSWSLINYMVFVHMVAGSLAGHFLEVRGRSASG